MAEDIFNINGAVPPADDQTISVDDAANEIGALVNSAVNFIDEQFMPGWESAQKYYDGLTDIQTVNGRSKVVMTAVRDAIRSARPSLLRIFLQADTIVEFVPNGSQSASLAAQQSKFVNSLFFRSNGYQALYDCIQNAMLKKLGVMKFWFNDSTEVKYYDLTALPTEEIDRISAQPDAMLARFASKTCLLKNFSSTRTPQTSKLPALSGIAAKCAWATPLQWASRLTN